MRRTRVLAKVVNWSFKLIYWPICRAYARHILGDNPADTIFRFMCSFQFWYVHRYWPDFLHPKRFTEKLWSRMLHERNPQLTMLSDKLRVRDFVTKRVGSYSLIELIWTGADPEEIPFSELPLRFVIKTNHGCGYNILVKNKIELNQARTKRQLKKWLSENFCQDKGLGIEWGYKNIKPVIIIEEFLEENKIEPVDYKFYCFSGRVEFLTTHFDRFREHKTRSFDRNFIAYDFRYDFEQWEGEFTRPSNFAEMVQLAESLAEGVNFMRVDLYSVENRTYFGELTPYPGGISTKFLPVSTDRILGEKWKTK